MYFNVIYFNLVNFTWTFLLYYKVIENQSFHLTNQIKIKI